MRRRFVPVIAALAGCNPAAGSGDRYVVDTTSSGVIRITSDAPNGWRDPARAWRLEEAGEYAGEEGTEGALAEPLSVAVDDAGRVYVADRKPAVIKVFGPDGALIRTIGREGSGPGEFRVAFLATWKDRLVAHDPQQARTSTFGTSGTFLTSWRSDCCYWTPIGVDSMGRVYIPAPNFAGPASPRGDPWVRYRLDGTVLDTLVIPRPPEDGRHWTIRSGAGANEMVMRMSVPFTPQRPVALHPWGGFVYGWSGDYALAVSPTGRDTSRLIRRAWQPDPIPDQRRQAEVDARVRQLTQDGRGMDEAGLRAEFRVGDIPTTAPAFMTLDVDRDGRIWARQLVGSDSTRTRYDVFDAEGRWMGPVELPRAVPEWGAIHFGRGAIYAAVEDAAGRPVVKRWRLVR